MRDLRVQAATGVLIINYVPVEIDRYIALSSALLTTTGLDLTSTAPGQYP
jgi:hypothetical protein